MTPSQWSLDPEVLSRVVVIGTSCSGKTTFARNLAGWLGVPHIELDAIYWMPGWQGREDGEFRAMVEQAVAQPRWVLDGNYSRVRDITWGQATAVIWLDYPFAVVLRQALSRTLRRSLKREVLWSGNRESFQRSFFSRESILLWVLQTYNRRRRQYPLILESWSHTGLTRLVLHHPRQAGQFLDWAAEVVSKTTA